MVVECFLKYFYHPDFILFGLWIPIDRFTIFNLKFEVQ